MNKWDIFLQRSVDTLVVLWKNKRVVTMFSTKATGSKQDMTDIPTKWPNLPPTPKPDIVLDYTKYIGSG